MKKALYFPLATPTVEMKVTAKGASGSASCFVGFKLFPTSEAEQISRTWHDLLSAMTEQVEAKVRENKELGLTEEVYPDSSEMDEFLFDKILYIRDLPLMTDHPTRKGHYTTAGKLDTRNVTEEQKQLFDEGTDFNDDSLVLHQVFSDLIVNNLAWKTAFNNAFSAVLLNRGIVDKASAQGNSKG